jgi:hypothetical protein
MTTKVLKRLFTVDEFHRMAEAGVFDEDDRLELLDGEIVHMSAIGSRHAGTVESLVIPGVLDQQIAVAEVLA